MHLFPCNGSAWKQSVSLLLTATHCNTLQHTATRCNTLQHIATVCNTLQHAAMRYNTLQHITHATEVQHIANITYEPGVRRNNLRESMCLSLTLQRTATRCNTLQYTATHCNALQHTAMHCLRNRSASEQFTEQTAAKLLCDVMNALRYLHSMLIGSVL